MKTLSRSKRIWRLGGGVSINFNEMKVNSINLDALWNKEFWQAYWKGEGKVVRKLSDNSLYQDGDRFTIMGGGKWSDLPKARIKKALDKIFSTYCTGKKAEF